MTCKGKMLMQKIWADGCDWDAPLTGNLKAEVGDFSTALGSTFTIPRFFGNPMALHIFCDASEQAYATVAYVVSDRGCKFVLSKTRVKPVKVVTLPRMELLGTLLGSRVLEFLNEEVFKSAIKTFVWTDSTIALGWIVSLSSRYKPFVGNRIRGLSLRALPRLFGSQEAAIRLTSLRGGFGHWTRYSQKCGLRAQTS